MPTDHNTSHAAKAVGQEVILARLLARHAGTVALDAWGETSLFYNPHRALPRGVYFATVKMKDGENDRASDLDRDGVFRLNVGTSKPLFVERFGPPPSRPGKGRAIEGPWDFTVRDRLTPHPVYGWMCWVSVLNPTEQTLDGMNDLIEAAYAKAKAAYERKLRIAQNTA